MQITSAGYPADLVSRPLPAQFDLRNLIPLKMTDQPYEIAKMIFNRRAARAADLAEADVPEMEALGRSGPVAGLRGLVLHVRQERRGYEIPNRHRMSAAGC